MKRIFLSLLIVPAAVVFSAIARGQNLEQEPLALAGTLKGVAPGGVLQVAANEKEVWNIKVEANPQDISFSGTAEKTFLKPGMFVELRGQIGRHFFLESPQHRQDSSSTDCKEERVYARTPSYNQSHHRYVLRRRTAHSPDRSLWHDC